MTAFNLADLFEIVADACPDRIALVTDAPPGGTAGRPAGTTLRLTYAELDARANRVAHHLSAAGVRAGDHVGILSYNRAEWLESMIGCFKLRAAPVNVNYRYVADELSHLLGDSACVALIAERSLLARVDRAALPRLRHVLVIEDSPDGDVSGTPGAAPTGHATARMYEEALAQAPDVRDFGPRSGDDPYLLYTGGTTGLPKGVLWRSEDIFFAAMGGGNFGGPPIERPELLAAAAGREPLRAQVHAPLMHGGGQWISWITLTTGGTIILWSERSFDARRSLRLAVRERSQILMLVGNGMAQPIADELATGSHPDLAVFAFGSGGAPLSPDVRQRLLAAVPGAYVSDNLGGSETGAMGASDGSGRFRLGPEFAVLGPDLVPVGARPGAVGIVARTGHIPLGYWADEKKTAETFVRSPDGRRWVLQGDYARVEEDGAVTLLGRGSLVINTGGEKVYAEEVETVLRAHPAVAEAMVIGVADPRLGQRVTAVVAAAPAAVPGAEPAAAPAGSFVLDQEALARELMAHCRSSLAGYKVPREFRFTEGVRHTPVGKPDYAWARSLFAAPG
ncbi:AMP-binding protein [Actinomadura scrupuli]|uniref:AMP-binding protein n=1 Tax=Actinomadura scrupuli TaxID=559629 RepID=UPI003D96E95D